MSVSGLHVGFLVIGLTWFFSFLRIPKRLQIIPLVLGVGFYIMMTGMESPVLRAGIMMIIYTIGNFFGANTKDQVNRLALAAVVLLFWDPIIYFKLVFNFPSSPPWELSGFTRYLENTFRFEAVSSSPFGMPYWFQLVPKSW